MAVFVSVFKSNRMTRFHGRLRESAISFFNRVPFQFRKCPMRQFLWILFAGFCVKGDNGSNGTVLKKSFYIDRMGCHATKCKERSNTDFFFLDCPSHCYDAVSLCETAYIRDNNPHLRWVLNERQTILRDLRDEHQGPIATKTTL